ncbi:MAG TPA: hypothetical protein VFW00_09875 [Rhodocyclaceae bacterium]|nr:hypothetical protein [Rhodocyclaceae bacterium]
MSEHEYMTNVWHVTGRCIAHPPPPGWRDDLIARLGQRPRRIGVWSELASYGALRCLEDAQEVALPRDSIVRVSSKAGTATAFTNALRQSHEGYLLPVSFLQSQPSQMLAALVNHLNWRGDASYITCADPLAEISLACAEAHHRGMLIGWVDDSPILRSVWLRIVPSAAPPRSFSAATMASFDVMSMEYFKLAPAGLLIA